MGADELLVLEDHREPVVALRVEVPVGEWSGWARTHHLADVWQAQVRDPDGAIARRMDELGVALELNVGTRSATLATSCRTGDLGAVVELVHRVLTHPDLDRRDLRRRRQTRRLAWEAQLRDPWFRLHRQVARLIFPPGDPRLWAGEKPPRASTDVAELTGARATALALPGRAVGLAGDVTREQAEEVVRGLLPPLAAAPPTGVAPALRPARTAAERPRTVEVEMAGLTQVYLALAAPAPGLSSADYPALLVADHVLGGHFYSRLSVALRHEAGDTYAAGTNLPRDDAGGAYTLYTFTNTGNAEAVESRLREVLATFQRGGISEEERAAAAGFLTGRLAFGRQSPDQVLQRRLWERGAGLEAGGWEALVRGAAALPLDEVNEFIARFYLPERFSLVRVRPKR